MAVVAQVLMAALELLLQVEEVTAIRQQQTEAAVAHSPQTVVGLHLQVLLEL
jgi:hypothetical protein